MLKKKCPKCGEYTYSASREIWKCIVCGAKLDEVEAVPAEKEEKNAKNSAKKKL